MAQFVLNGMEELAAALDRLGRFDEIAPAMLEAAVPILEEEVKRQVRPHWNTGDMYESIKRTSVEVGRGGAYTICVRPTDVDRNGIRNMEKLAWLEFGAKGRAAVPVLKTAVLNAAPLVCEKMREVFRREAGG